MAQRSEAGKAGPGLAQRGVAKQARRGQAWHGHGAAKRSRRGLARQGLAERSWGKAKQAWSGEA